MPASNDPLVSVFVLNYNGREHLETCLPSLEAQVYPKDRLRIEVIDNGPGLPKHNRNRLLEPYVTTKGNKGTGLGLAIVLKSVEQHGGTLSLEDAPPAPGRSHGALIRISLPLSKSPAQKASREEPATAAANSNA